LHWAAIYGNLLAVTWLAKTHFSGANINMKCEKGHTAMHDAIIGYCKSTPDKKEIYKQIITTLFNAGASAFVRDEVIMLNFRVYVCGCILIVLF
jgi:hypothetical protein